MFMGCGDKSKGNADADKEGPMMYEDHHHHADHCTNDGHEPQDHPHSPY